MKRIFVIIAVATVLISTGYTGYRAGLRHRSDWTVPYDVTVPGTNDLSNADRLIIQMEEGKQMTIDLRARPNGRLGIFAGKYPPEQDDPMSHSLVIYPSAGNVVRLSVESRKKREASNK